MSVDLKGFDELRRRVDEVKRKGDAGVQLKDLFHPSFMKKYTDFQSIDEMAEASGLDIKSLDDFNKIPKEFIRGHTRFMSWDEMSKTATEQWVARNLQLK